MYGPAGTLGHRDVAGELVLPDKIGAPDFRGLHRAMSSPRHYELVFFALLHRDGQDWLRCR
jgi:hypothetical protein